MGAIRKYYCNRLIVLNSDAIFNFCCIGLGLFWCGKLSLLHWKFCITRCWNVSMDHKCLEAHENCRRKPLSPAPHCVAPPPKHQRAPTCRWRLSQCVATSLHGSIAEDVHDLDTARLNILYVARNQSCNRLIVRHMSVIVGCAWIRRQVAKRINWFSWKRIWVHICKKWKITIQFAYII